MHLLSAFRNAESRQHHSRDTGRILMSETELLIFLGIPVLIACLGGCRLVSKYTNMAMLEPLCAVVLTVPLAVIGAHQLSVLPKQYLDYGIRSLFDSSTSNAYTIISTIIVLLAVTGVVCMMILVLVFAFYGISAIFAKGCKATLVKAEKPEGKKAKFAFYKVDGKVYQCAVAGVSKKLVVGNEYKVRLNKLQQKVYDKATIPTCLAGMVMFLLMLSSAIFIAAFT